MNSSGDDQQLQPDPVEQLPQDFTAFFIDAQGVYLRYAWQYLRNRQDAEDAVQNAGMKIHAKWEQVLAHENYKAFAHRIMRGVVIDYWRARTRSARAEQAAIEAARGHAGVAQIERLGVYDALDRAMEELERREPVQAECVRLRVARLSYPEIAAVLGITPGTARTYYSLGRRRAQHLATAYLNHDTEEGEPS